MEEINRDNLVSQTVDLLGSIRSVDDLIESRTMVFNAMEQIFISAIESIKQFMEGMDQMPEKEQKSKALMFQDENYLLPPDIMNELERLETIPGSEDFMAQFSIDLEKQLDPLLDMYTDLSGKLMNMLIGGFMGDLEDEIKESGSEFEAAENDFSNDSISKEQNNDDFVFDYDNPETPRMFYELYAAKSLDELDLDLLAEDIEEQMQNDVWELESLTDDGFGDYTESDMESISEIQNRAKVFIPQLEKEFNRLGMKSNNKEAANKAMIDVKSRVSLKFQEIRHYLSKLD